MKLWIIDKKEWIETFSQDDAKNFESSPEYDLICAKIGKARKVLLKHFEEVKVKDNFVIFSDAVKILRFLNLNLTKGQMKILLKPAECKQKSNTFVDYARFLDIYKDRASNVSSVPRIFHSPKNES